MNNETVTRSALYRGLTLSERVRGQHPSAAISQNGSGSECSRLRRWRAAFPDSPTFVRRLAMLGLDEAALRDILEQRPAELRDRIFDVPPWIADLSTVFGQADEPAGEVSPSRAEGPITLLLAFEPLLARGRAQVRSGLRHLLTQYPGFTYEPSAIGELDRSLGRSVHSMAARALVLELNIARLQGILAAATPEERFAEFVERLAKPETRASLIGDYPVLFQQVAQRVEQWVAASLEFVGRLAGDALLLRGALFAGRDPGPLIDIKAGEGDRHCSGRTVTIAHFASGSAVVYKPRSLAVDRHFYNFLQWLNTRGARPTFRDLTVIDRGSYGWEEYAAPSACESPEQVERYYERCGAYLAVLYALAATDFHFENVIAAGEHPVLIDLEALFHRAVQGDAPTDAVDVASRAISASVLGVGLLPYRLWSGPDSAGIDLSGIGAEADQLSPFDIPVLAQLGTDRMAFEPARVPLGGRSHRPSVAGVDVESARYAEAVVCGFSRTYRLLCARRDELLAPGGVLDSFADDEVRVIVRPTQTYGTLLEASFHPDLLGDALEREMFLDKLWSIPHPKYFDCVVADECADLQRGDVPRFSTSPGARSVRTSDGRLIEDVLPESGLTAVRRRIAHLCEDDLARQLWYVRASLGSEVRRMPHRVHHASPRKVSRERLLAQAVTVGERLAHLAVQGDAGATWIGATSVQRANVEPPRGMNVQPLGPDLYDGLAGVAFFLGYLGTITGECRYENLARRALHTMRGQIARERPRDIGALSGWGGLVYAVAHLGDLWNEPELFAEAVGYAERGAELIEADGTFDVVGGAAGFVCALLALDSRASSSVVRGIAQRSGEHLLANFMPSANGGGWIAPAMSDLPLTGFSHGAAGIALAMLRLSAVSGDDRFRAAALGAIAYERSVFSPQAQNWPDFRTVNRRADGAAIGAICQTLWCHGAPGIGLARIACADLLAEPMFEAEVDIALETTVRDGFGSGHSLCHGAFGNLELLHVAAQRRQSAALRSQVQLRAAAELDDAERNGWRCGNSAAVETPGLMTGLAGIGYGLLRLAEPARVPSVLLFDPPIGAPCLVGVGR